MRGGGERTTGAGVTGEELVEFEVSIFIYSYLCDQRDHQRDLTTRLSRYPPEKSDSEKRPPLSLKAESYRYLL